MNMTTVDIFEEFRFIFELVAAEVLFIMPFAQKKRHAVGKGMIGFAGLLCISLFYFKLSLFPPYVRYPQLFRTPLYMSWYIFLVLLSLFLMNACFWLNKCDLLFMTISAYAAQHIEYVLVNEMGALGLFPELRENLGIYIPVCILTCALLYWGLYRVFAVRLKASRGELLKDTSSAFLFYGSMLAVLIASAFMQQHVFRFSAINPNYYSAISDVLTCILILIVQYSAFHNSQLFEERKILEQLLYERKKQYELSRETVELVNLKCHDLKNQMLALKEMKEGEQFDFFRDIESTIQTYDSCAYTENEVLNTILTEKSFYCERHGIRMTSIADAKKMDFIKTPDIYALIGNALDNAIECVEQYEGSDKRILSMNISARGQFLCIQVCNYFEGSLKLEGGVPVSSKEDPYYHGYGIKSMRMIAEKYKGTMEMGTDGTMFILEIVIPIPRK